MNRRARLRLRGLATLADPARNSAPIARGIGGTVEPGELCEIPVSRAGGASDAVGVAREPEPLEAVGVAELPVALPTGAAADRRATMDRGRALRALRTARALRLAIALGMVAGTRVE
jgi:hypothetical protein